MILGGTNFLLMAWLLRGRVSRPARDEEFRLYLATIAVAGLVVWGLLLASDGGGLPGETLRHSLFQVVSILTTTGFSTADYQLWRPPRRPSFFC